MAAFKSEDYVIKIEILINAKPEAIFPNLVSARMADKWMPWQESDPKVQMTYTEPMEMSQDSEFQQI